MSNYIDYNYYSNTFKGNLIPQEEFDKYAKDSSNRIRNRILNKDISFFETEIKDVACSIADILYNQYLNKQKIVNITNGTEKIITSEKLDDWSRNYSNISISDLKSLSSDNYVNNLIEQELYNHLFLTGLLNCGVCCVR